MMAWYSDIQTLTEKTGEEKMAFVRRHARSISAGSKAFSMSSGFDDDEADAVPYAAMDEVSSGTINPQPRPSPGGHFESDIDVIRGLQLPMSPSTDAGSIHGIPVMIPSALPSEPIFAGERRDIKQSAYLTPERARGSPTPDRQRASPTADRLRATPSPAPKVGESSAQSRQASRDGSHSPEHFPVMNTPANLMHNLSSSGVHNFPTQDPDSQLVRSAMGPTVYSVAGPARATSQSREETSEPVRDPIYTNNNRAHSTIPADTKVRDLELEQQEANNVTRPEPGLKPKPPLEEYANYSEKPYELDAYVKERMPEAQVETASSSIYGAYDGPAHSHYESSMVNGQDPAMAQQMTYNQTHVMSGPVPTFNQATYDPVAEMGLGISAKQTTTSVNHGGSPSGTSNGFGGAPDSFIDGVVIPTHSTGDYAAPAPRSQFIRQGTANTVNTVSALPAPRPFLRTA